MDFLPVRTSSRIAMNQIVFKTDGTWTPSAGLKFARIRMIAAGGAGAGIAATAAGEVDFGGGGGAGAFLDFFIDAAELAGLGASFAAVVGAKAAGDTDGGATGGTTKLGLAAGTTVELGTCAGGVGGATVPPRTTGTIQNGGNGGAVTNPTAAVTIVRSQNGRKGSGAWCLNEGARYIVHGGEGADSPFGPGGQGHVSSEGANGAGGGTANETNFGAGGGGAANGHSDTAKAGGDSAQGVIIIEEYFEGSYQVVA